MNKIGKFLARLDAKRRGDVENVLAKISGDDLSGLDIRKLKGREHEYRVRIGAIRILFTKTIQENIVTDLGFRGDNTY